MIGYEEPTSNNKTKEKGQHTHFINQISSARSQVGSDEPRLVMHVKLTLWSN